MQWIGTEPQSLTVTACVHDAGAHTSEGRITNGEREGPVMLSLSLQP